MFSGFGGGDRCSSFEVNNEVLTINGISFESIDATPNDGPTKFHFKVLLYEYEFARICVMPFKETFEHPGRILQLLGFKPTHILINYWPGLGELRNALF